MSAMRYIEIDGKSYLWRDVLQLRRDQRKAHARAQQPALFDLREDCRPRAERTAAGRYLEPSLFSMEASPARAAFLELVQLRYALKRNLAGHRRGR